MLQGKVKGIVYAYDVGDEYKMVTDLGIEWIRAGAGFPWTDRMFGTLSPRYLEAKERIRKAHDAGLKIMCTTPGLGGYRYVKEEGRTRWVDAWPEFCGEPGTEEFYKNVEDTCEWIARDLEGLVGPLWQNMNEIDIPTFRGDYAPIVAADTCRASARGIVKADPNAMCGTNLSHYSPDALEMADLVYRKGHTMAYVGDDQYFGSWQGKDVYEWSNVIDALYERYRLPVLANEWGYSSGGVVVPTPEDTSNVPLGWPTVCYCNAWHHEVEGGHTDEVAAQYMKEGLRIFAEHPHCLGSFIFCWKDALHCYHCGKSDCPAECFWGIVDTNTQPKAAYYAVKEALEAYY